MIPIAGMKPGKEQEDRASSALLAVLSIVRDLSKQLFQDLGAPQAFSAKVKTYAQPMLKLEGKTENPDGLVVISHGTKKPWFALVEVKTGKDKLDAEQLDRYRRVAQNEKFDALITISNEIAVDGVHPALTVRSNAKVKVHHISWSKLMFTAVRIRDHKGVDDPEQGWILNELIRYLESDQSGAAEFSDMGPSWIAVVNGAHEDALRKNSDDVRAVVERWNQLLERNVQRLGAETGNTVQTSRRHRGHKELADGLASSGQLGASLKVPNAVSDIDLLVDLKAKRGTASITVRAPEDGTALSRCKWLVKQLNGAPPGLVVEAFAKGAHSPAASETLARISEAGASILVTEKMSPPVKFRLVLSDEKMGVGKRALGKDSFIKAFERLVDGIYDVVGRVDKPSPKVAKRTTVAPKAGSVSDGDGDGEAAASSSNESPASFATDEARIGSVPTGGWTAPSGTAAVL